MLNLFLTLAALLAPVAHAQDPAPAPAASATEAVAASPALTRRAEDVVRILNGEGDASAVFAQSFLDQAPPERIARIAEAVRRRHGQALGVARIDVKSPTEGTIHLLFAQTEIPILLQVVPDDEARIEGLLFQNMGRGADRR